MNKFTSTSPSAALSRPNPLLLHPQLETHERDFLRQIDRTITVNMGNPVFNVSLLAAKMYLSVSQLNRKLKDLIKLPAGQLIRNTRMNYAAELLLKKTKSVNEIAFQVGYANQSHFCRCFKRCYGCPPSKYFQQKKMEQTENGEKR